MSAHDPMISTSELAAKLGAPDLVVIDASWFMPGTPRDPDQEYAEGHIPGAVRFDIDEVADQASGLPHMAASPAEFATAARRHGVEPNSLVVIYDSTGLFSAPRVWWNFRLMGHERVFVLDGGLPRWIAEDRPVEIGWREPQHGEFRAEPKAALVADWRAVKAASDSGSAQIVDARAAERFAGAAPEPRAGLRSGHIPGARNVPWQAVIAEDGALKHIDELQAAFEAAGVDLTRPIITSCGSGVSASILALGLARLGRDDVAVYDGSWTEWGGREDLPIATGPA
jgi:thiosulfate/3-mercaptopyruvate sulfurtransferase